MGTSRYKLVTFNGKQIEVPIVPIKERETDKFIEFNVNKKRLDRVAEEIYKFDDLYWIILLGNPEYSLEFDIPVNQIIRIPFPLSAVINELQLNFLDTNKR